MSSPYSPNELSTPVSYYQLYRSLSPSDLTPQVASTEGNTNNASFWQTDEWTEQDEQLARELLETHESKCAVPAQRAKQYERFAAKNWDKFYQHHGTNFFNDRHYLKKAFPQEFGDESVFAGDTSSCCLVEIGCGVGNNILPLMKQHPRWHVWGFDISKVAVELMTKDERFDTSRANAGVWDISNQSEAPPVKEIADICTLLFCLSAVSPDKMKIAAANVAATLKPGGVVVFRDYGRFDEAQMKLGASRAKCLGENFYVKSDGTRCYYFSLKDLEELFVKHAGLQELELKFIRRIYQNRAKDEQRRRVWVQARFRKPLS